MPGFAIWKELYRLETLQLTKLLKLITLKK